MRRTAFVHIGLAKTGTTAIQLASASLEDSMAQDGLQLLKTGRIRPDSGQHCLAWRIREDPRAEMHCPDYDLSETRAELAASVAEHVVVSSEEFSSLAFEALNLAKLRELFDGYRLCGIVYVREQVEFFNSFFVELVKDLGTGEAIGEFVQRISAEARYDYANWMQPFAEAFDDFIVRPYDSNEFVGGAIVKDFHTIIGYKGGQDLPNQFRNRSLSSFQVAALQQAVRRLEMRGLKPASKLSNEYKRRLSAVIQVPEMQSSGRYWGIPPEVTRRLRDHFRPLNRSFFRKFAKMDYDFPFHQSPPRLNVAGYKDLNKDIKRQVSEIVESVDINT